MKKAVVFLGLISFSIFSCKKTEEPQDIHEEETITTVKLNFTENGNPGNTFTVQYSDPDGAGGNPPSIDTIHLENTKTYTVAVEFWNESVSPAEDLTPEILSEAAEHIVCYDALNGLDVTFTITDTDANSLPIGLASTWTVNAANNGDFQITLKHQPGVKDGTCAPGDTDVEAVFPVSVN